MGCPKTAGAGAGAGDAGVEVVDPGGGVCAAQRQDRNRKVRNQLRAAFRVRIGVTVLGHLAVRPLRP